MAKIELNNIDLTFSIRQTRKITLKEWLVQGIFWNNPAKKIHALKTMSITLQDGDRLGVIGHNGAGKSTLLKLMAGIYPPTNGSRNVEGNICSLCVISLGFEPDASGWDNIRYRAYLQGETPATLKGKIQSIAEFSELGDFLNIPVRYYSAGMLIRLAFSIASAVEPEILLIDEVLAVGDLAFQIKARKRMEQMMSKASLLVTISHDLQAICELCNRAIWIDHGAIRLEGDVRKVVEAYRQCATNSPGLHTAAA